MSIVLDVSALMGVVLEDEDGTYAEAVLEVVEDSSGYVPMLFWFEVRNAMIMGERRGRTTPLRTASFLADLAAMPIEVDYQPHESAVMALARTHKLMVYDASYLELAQRKGLALATNDRALKDAALLEGVTRWSPE